MSEETNDLISYENKNSEQSRPHEIINPELLVSKNIYVNELPFNVLSQNEDFPDCSVAPILIEDESEQSFTKFDQRSLSLITYEDPILKLDSLMQNFKDLFLGGRPFQNDFNETLCLGSGIGDNDSESKEEILTENESEDYVLEHKSVNLEATHSTPTYRTTIEKINSEGKSLVFNTDKGKKEGLNDILVVKHNHNKCNKSDLEHGISLSLQELSVEKNIEHFKNNSKYFKQRCSKSESSTEEIHSQGSPCILVNNSSIKDYASSADIGGETFGGSQGDSSKTERIFILEGDKELDIHEAVRRDDESLLRRLLAMGADPNEPDWETKGNPPLVQAALRQNIAIIKALCEAGCDMNQTSVRGETALHMVVSRRPVNLPLLDTLLAAGSDANVQDKLRGCSALHCVSGFADDEPLVFLKLVALTDVNLSDHRHSTALHRVAATSNRVLMVEQLLQQGADPSIQNDRGETALCVALERGWEAGVLALVAGGTDLRCTNLYRETALHVAARHNQANIVAALLHHGAEVNAQDLAGNTALHLAAGRGYVGTVQQLLTCPHLDLDSHNSDHATPLTCAVESGFISVVQMLVKAEQVDLQPALDLAKHGFRRLSQPEMCQLLAKELARRQTPHLT